MSGVKRAWTAEEIDAFVAKQRERGALRVTVGDVVIEFAPAAAPAEHPARPPAQQAFVDDMEHEERARAARDAVEFWSAPGRV